MADKQTYVCHPFAPVWNEQSELLILGSFPSVKSRENGFYYGHPQNRFWLVLSNITESALPVTNDEKRAFLLEHHIALWDCIASCEITCSSDTSIKNAVPNDLYELLGKSNIRSIFTNGKEADHIYQKYLLPKTGIKAVYLPSTSPANAAFSAKRLTQIWKDTIFPKK